MFDTKPYEEKITQAIAHFENELKKIYNSTTNKIVFERPLLEFDTLYVFNKRKAESFIYDFQEYYNTSIFTMIYN